MNDRPSKVFTARWVLPITSPPIHRGWVRIARDRIIDDRIVEVGSRDCPADADDLGDVALLPGLVNAHTHLEFSNFSEPVGRPGIPLSQWIGMVIESRGQTSDEQKSDAIALGCSELDRTGTALVGEIATPPCRYPTTAPKLVSFAEVLGLDPQRGAERLAAASQWLTHNAAAAISPHAPYSTPPDLIRKCVEMANSTQRPVAMHVAESPDERTLLTEGSGPFAESLKAIGVWREHLFPWGPEPFIELIGMLAAAPRSLIVHGNDLNANEVDAIARHRNLTVVYCPRTHDFFRHAPHPVDRLLRAGVRVALGTDSRASNPDLNVWGEVQHLLNHRTDLDPHDVLAMATVHGADAMGYSSYGRLEVDCAARFAMVCTKATSVDELFADLARGEARKVEV